MTNQRIDSLDLLRGVAVLGILLMNMVSFGMPLAAYMNPFAIDDLSQADRIVWFGLHVFADMKFMNIFSMLFGAGVLIFGERAMQKGAQPRELHSARMWWLLLFGLIHAYFIWWGDILFTYAVCGLLFTRMLALSNKKMLIIASVFLLIGWALLVMMNYVTLIYESDTALELWQPTQAMVQAEIEQQTGSWLSRISSRAEIAIALQLSVPFFTYWRVTALMLVGVVLYRTGFLSAKLSSRTYLSVAATTIFFGVLFTSIGAGLNVRDAYSLEQSFVYGMSLNYFSSLLTSIGFIALVMLLAKSSGVAKVKLALRSVGKTAFSNYILQSLIGLIVFNFLGYFGEFGYAQLILCTLAVWAVNIGLSILWLSNFKQGPLEALWRRLTYRAA